MKFTFEATVEIYDDDIDEMVEKVKNGEDNIYRAIEDVVSCFDEFEWRCFDYYREDLKKEVERRLKDGT